MRNFINTNLLVSILAIAPHALALSIGETPSTIVLSGDNGTRADGEPWSSEMIKGKVWMLLYIDPDEKGLNDKMELALKEQGFPKDKYGSIAVVNLEATWLPNSIIISSLASKQKEYPDVVYVKDLKKTLVKKWGLKDDAYVTLVFGKDGKLLFQENGALDGSKITELIETINSHL